MSSTSSSKNHSCKHCCSTFTARKNLYAHMRTFHPGTSLVICTYCEENCASKIHLRNHIKSEHPAAFSYPCSLCDKFFAAQASLRRHLKIVHPVDAAIVPANSNVICSLCDKKFRLINHLHQHIQADHKNIPLLFENRVFHWDEEFEEWKAKTERDSQCRYVKCSGSKTMLDGRTVRLLLCHRSGSYEIKQNRKRMKCKGTKKIGKTCPALITLYRQEIDGAVEIEVVHQSVHAGHSAEVEAQQSTNLKEKQLASSTEVTQTEFSSDIITKTLPPKKRVSIKHKENSCVDELYLEKPSPEKIDDNVQTMFVDKIFSDVIIKAPGIELPAHQCILSSKSPVFAEILGNGMVEKNEAVIEIQDFQQETVTVMLDFIYTSELPTLRYELAVELLRAAEKYSISNLKKLCRDYLFSMVNASSALELLLQADMHSVCDLKEEALDFICANCKEFNSSEKYSRLITRPDLLIELLVKMSKISTSMQT